MGSKKLSVCRATHTMGCYCMWEPAPSSKDLSEASDQRTLGNFGHPMHAPNANPLTHYTSEPHSRRPAFRIQFRIDLFAVLKHSLCTCWLLRVFSALGGELLEAGSLRDLPSKMLGFRRSQNWNPKITNKWSSILDVFFRYLFIFSSL